MNARDELVTILIHNIDWVDSTPGSAVEAIHAAGYRKSIVLSYVVIDRDGKFIKDFGDDKVSAQEFAIESTAACTDSGIDWEYRVAEIVEEAS
jgi:hypothetical protein